MMKSEVVVSSFFFFFYTNPTSITQPQHHTSSITPLITLSIHASGCVCHPLYTCMYVWLDGKSFPKT
jgi:hypothetical protein